MSQAESPHRAILDRFQQAATAYKKGDVVTAASEMNSTSANVKTLQDEMRAAGFEVSP